MTNKTDTTEKNFTVEEVESVVTQKLEEVQKAAEQEKTAHALESFTSEIKAKVEALEKSDQEKEETIEALRTAISEKEEALEKAGEELSKLQGELEETKSKLEASEKEIAEAKEREMLTQRVNMLADRDLLRSNEENQVKQIEKVRTMSEDEFSAYVEDLEDIKNKTLASFKKEEVEEEEEKEEETSDETSDETTEDVDAVRLEAEEVAAKKMSEDLDEDSDIAEKAEDLIRDLLAQVSKRSTTGAAEDADVKDSTITDGEAEDTKVDPKNFESAAVTSPAKESSYESLSTGFVERLCK